MATGFFITFEGGEGTGKSTQLELLRRHLAPRREVVETREPGGTPVAEAARAILLDPALDPDALTELFLLAAARRDHVETVIRPAMARGAVVLCDRFTDSSVVYQGLAGGVDAAVVDEINHLATGGLSPGLTLVFDLDPEAALPRVHTRNGAAGGAESRIDERPAEFHRRVREAFLELARREPGRIRVVAAGGTPEEIHQRVRACLPEALG